MTKTDLYTSGGEFTLPNGDNYIGGFHIHVSQGAMVGSFHKTEEHDLLTPVNSQVRSYVLGVQNELRRNPSPIIPTVSSSGGGGGGGGGGY
tara:strand:- start:1664 stop:1936 length:273 start_codon:yes stop_codon:yes gene_type:complete